MNGVFLGGVDNSNSNTSGHGYSASKRTTIHRPHGRTKLAIDSCTRQRLRFCHLLPEELIILSNMQQFRKKSQKKYLLKDHDSNQQYFVWEISGFDMCFY